MCLSPRLLIADEHRGVVAAGIDHQGVARREPESSGSGEREHDGGSDSRVALKVVFIRPADASSAARIEVEIERSPEVRLGAADGSQEVQLERQQRSLLAALPVLFLAKSKTAKSTSEEIHIMSKCLVKERVRGPAVKNVK